MSVDALLVSMNEPQLDACLQSISEQTVPFSKLIRVTNVIPESAAFNQGIKQVTGDWVMHIGGDFILYKNAVEIATDNINKDADNKIGIYTYGVYSSFLKRDIVGCHLYRRIAMEGMQALNSIVSDRKLQRNIKDRGWGYSDLRDVIIADHFRDPSEFQVFSRFYAKASKVDHRMYHRWLMGLAATDGNPLYHLALEAFEFGRHKMNYPTSHNADFDRAMYDEFKEWRKNENTGGIN